MYSFAIFAPIILLTAWKLLTTASSEGRDVVFEIEFLSGGIYYALAIAVAWLATGLVTDMFANKASVHWYRILAGSIVATLIFFTLMVWAAWVHVSFCRILGENLVIVILPLFLVFASVYIRLRLHQILGLSFATPVLMAWVPVLLPAALGAALLIYIFLLASGAGH
jgi:hypothetical protein